MSISEKPKLKLFYNSTKLKYPIPNNEYILKKQGDKTPCF